jgi:hypothetical protein
VRSDNQSGRIALTIVVPIAVLLVIVVVPMTMIVLSIVVVPMTMIVLSIAVAPMTMIVLSIVPAAVVVRLVFRGSYEVHRPIAGIILAAMLAPIPRMAGRHV